MKPLIFIPGIEATNLVNANSFDFSNVWNSYDTLGASMVTGVVGQYIEEKLQIDPQYDSNDNMIVERHHIARLPYERAFHHVIEKLKSEYGINDPVYLFGYDWRLSNVENGKRLNSFITYLQQKLKHNSISGFRFLTHSMGGLVLSCYLKSLTTYDHIDKVIFCAPPFLGSPYAYIHMIKGVGGFKSFLNTIFGRDEDIRKVVRTYPSIYELLPSYEKAITFDDGTVGSFLNKESWQSNIYNDSELGTIFEHRLNALQDFRFSVTNKFGMMDLKLLPVDVRRKMVVVAGASDDTVVYLKADRMKDSTKSFLRLDKLKDKTDEQGNEIDRNGDGTVPYISSTLYKDYIRTIVVKKEGFFDEYSNSLDFHGLFLNDSRVRNIICRYFGCDFYAANFHSDKLTALKGKNKYIWYPIGDSVEDISNF